MVTHVLDAAIAPHAAANSDAARTAQVRVPFMQVGTALLCSRSTTMEVVAALLPSQKERRYSSKKERRRSFHSKSRNICFFGSGDAASFSHGTGAAATFL